MYNRTGNSEVQKRRYRQETKDKSILVYNVLLLGGFCHSVTVAVTAVCVPETKQIPAVVFLVYVVVEVNLKSQEKEKKGYFTLVHAVTTGSYQGRPRVLPRILHVPGQVFYLLPIAEHATHTHTHTMHTHNAHT